MEYLSITDQMRGRAEELKKLVAALSQHASIIDLYDRDRHSDYDFSLVVLYANPYDWEKLPADGQGIQQRLHDQYGHFRETVRLMLRGKVNPVQQELEEADGIVTRFIAHERADSRTVEKGVNLVTDAIDKMISLILGTEDASDHRVVFAPDTNALIYNPQLENWAFDDVPCFRFVLMPTVLQELDQLKVTGKADSLREKAERVIRQVKEFRRRGPLHLGVTIRSNVSELVG